MSNEENLRCPISYEIMTDPVILCESGQTYDRQNIKTWLNNHTTDPLTRISLKSANITANYSVRNTLESLGHKLCKIEKIFESLSTSLVEHETVRGEIAAMESMVGFSPFVNENNEQNTQMINARINADIRDINIAQLNELLGRE